jgi:hypothetical protein
MHATAVVDGGVHMVHVRAHRTCVTKMVVVPGPRWPTSCRAPLWVALCHVCDRRMWSSDMSVYERDAFLESLLVDGVVHMVHVRAHRG